MTHGRSPYSTVEAVSGYHAATPPIHDAPEKKTLAELMRMQQ
jgi:hypothetical protein